MMNWNVSLNYRSTNAHFDVLREAKRIYNVELLSYDGAPEQAPPKNILLLRGHSSWWGSAEDKELVRVLGDHISSLSETTIFFTETRVDTRL